MTHTEGFKWSLFCGPSCPEWCLCSRLVLMAPPPSQFHGVSCALASTARPHWRPPCAQVYGYLITIIMEGSIILEGRLSVSPSALGLWGLPTSPCVSGILVSWISKLRHRKVCVCCFFLVENLYKASFLYRFWYFLLYILPYPELTSMPDGFY